MNISASSILMCNYEQRMHIKLWTKEVYEYTNSQDDYDFKLLGSEKVNLVKPRNAYLASLELS